MRTEIYLIDDDGFYLQDDIRNVAEDQPLQESEIPIKPPQGLYGAKWTGTEWISTMTEQKYIESLNIPTSEPTFVDLQIEQNVDFDYRLSLIEMGLIE